MGDTVNKLLEILRKRENKNLAELRAVINQDPEEFTEQVLRQLKKKDWSKFEDLVWLEDLKKSILLLVLGLVEDKFLNKKETFYERINKYWLATVRLKAVLYGTNN